MADVVRPPPRALRVRMPPTGCLSFLLLVSVAAGPPEVRLERVGRLAHPAVAEASGIVRADDTRGSSGSTTTRATPRPVRRPPRRDARPGVRRRRPQHRLGRHRGRRPRPPLPRRHRQQRQAAAAAGDLPDRRARPVQGRPAGARRSRPRAYYRFPARGRFDAEGPVRSTAAAPDRRQDVRRPRGRALRGPVRPARPAAPTRASREGRHAPRLRRARDRGRSSADGRAWPCARRARCGVYGRAGREAWRPFALRASATGRPDRGGRLGR